MYQRNLKSMRGILQRRESPWRSRSQYVLSILFFLMILQISWGQPSAQFSKNENKSNSCTDEAGKITSSTSLGIQQEIDTKSSIIQSRQMEINRGTIRLIKENYEKLPLKIKENFSKSLQKITKKAKFEDQMSVLEAKWESGLAEVYPEELWDGIGHIFKIVINGVWIKLDLSGDIPPALEAHAQVYDPDHNIFTVFGGYTILSNNFEFFNDTWIADLNDGEMNWEKIDITDDNKPSPRYCAAAVLDNRESRILLYGGIDKNHNGLNDLWEFNIDDKEWKSLDITGNPNCTGSLIYTRSGNQLIHFNGSETYVLKLGGSNPEWERLYIGGNPPPERQWHEAVYDPRGHRMIIFGGREGAEEYEDFWELDLSTLEWQEVSVDGFTMPEGRYGMAMAFDCMTNHRLIVSGGLMCLNPPPPPPNISKSSNCLNVTTLYVFDFIKREWKWMDVESDDAPKGYQKGSYNRNNSSMLVFGGGTNDLFEYYLPSDCSSPCY